MYASPNIIFEILVKNYAQVSSILSKKLKSPE
jgi:hypothetical protein